MQRFISSSYIVLFFALVSCTPKYTRYIQNYQSTDSLHSATHQSFPDYNNLETWAAHPWQKDLSDSVSPKLRKEYRYDSSVDVFFIHPTTLTDDQDSSWNAVIDDPAINAKTDYSSILYQASVFNEYRVFAPRYRQAHIRAYYTADSVAGKQAFDTAYADVQNAFRTYLEEYNNGRPIIIASHSQGTTHALRLLNEFFGTDEMKSRLVVAYVTGMFIPGSNAIAVPLCMDSTETGCLCGWRTYLRGYTPDNIRKEKGSGIMTNPLTWETTADYAPRNLNTGAVLRDFNKMYVHSVDAQINEGILWISKPKFPGSFLLNLKNYHIADINLFYNNIRQNARTRVKAYNEKVKR